MAKQIGILPLQGAIGNIQFFKGKDGSARARQKTSIDKERFQTDPAFARTREAMAEFTTAAKGGKLLRHALNALVTRISDDAMSVRLNGALIKVIKRDKVNGRGLRNINDGDLSMLKGFEFSVTGVVSTTFTGIYGAVIDRASGQMTISINDLVPNKHIYAPREATHFQLHAASVDMDFKTGKFDYDQASTARLPLNNNPLAAMTLQPTAPANSVNPLLLFFGIEFWMETNGTWYELNSKVYNGVVVAEVSKV